MEEKIRTEIAAFRYQLIAGVVNRPTPLEPGEIAAYFRDQSRQEWEVPPDFKPRQFSIRTLERYKQQFEKGGFEALKPAVVAKRGTIAVGRDVLKEAEKLRQEKPDRSVEQIIFILEKTNVIEPGKLSQSTLSRHFRRNGMVRKRGVSESKDYGYKRFEADSFGRLWQSDFHHTLYLPDPLNPKKNRLAKLCCILDDYSRYIVHGQYYWDERMPCLEDTLKKAILKHSIPVQFYCDNGSAYSAGHISSVCSRLGIRLSHSTVRRPAGRGKIERFFQFVDSSFKPEAVQAILNKKISTIEELNQAFQTWLHGYYHLRVHGSTKESPQVRMSKYPVKQLLYSPEQLRRYFFLEEKRKVDKAGCISLNGATYEVPAELGRQTIELRYDPFEPDDAEVYIHGQFIGNAKLLDATQNFYQKNMKHRLTEIKKAEPLMEGQVTFSMLEAAGANLQNSVGDNVCYGMEGSS